MSPSSAAKNEKSVPLTAILTGVVFAVVAFFAVVYLNRPAQKNEDGGASPEAKAYLANLGLSDVTMQASENLMNQKVVEVLGNISNNGPRELKSIDVYCLFYGVDGRLLHRERLRIVGGVKRADLSNPANQGVPHAFR